MTNRQLAPKVQAWLKSTEAAPDDARRSVGLVSARAQQTPQRGRWWPLPSFRRRPDPRTATSIDSQPPTVTRRTRSMLNPFAAVTAGERRPRCDQADDAQHAAGGAEYQRLQQELPQNVALARA